MLSKCIGIISWFPDNILRETRKKNFRRLLKTLDTYFKLPLVIVAQNWREEDFDLEYSASIKVYSWPHALGITGARYMLREKLLQENYDYFIFLDDDIKINCTQQSVQSYFNELDKHPNMFGQVKKFQLFAISHYMLEKMDWDYISGLEAYKGEIWEEVAYYLAYKELYRNKFYAIKINNLSFDFPASEKDNTSTWYNKNINQTKLQRNTNKIYKDWIKYKLNAK